jgi:enoyl-CoA hydratase/carnithine racemase
MPTLEKDGDVFVLNLGDDENRFTPEWLTQMHSHLDTVASAEGPRALVTTATGKFFSNGLDLEWLGANADSFAEYVTTVHALLARPLALGVPSVAAIQGHAFAAGGMFALAHDFRVMRSDRGFFCLPEVDIHIPFTRGMSGLIQGRLSKKTAHEAMTTGRRYGGEDAKAAGIVDELAPEDAVLAAAMVIARPLAAKAGPTLATIKERMYTAALEALRNTQNPID